MKINGLSGNDLIFGLGDDDILCGGAGDEEIYGGDDDDQRPAAYTKLPAWKQETAQSESNV